MSQSQQNGLRALGTSQDALINQITATLSDRAHPENYNNFRLLVAQNRGRFTGGNPATQAMLTRLCEQGSHLSQAECRTIATEMVRNKTLFGTSTNDIGYEGGNVTSLFRLQTPELIQTAVREHTGNIPILGGATIGQAFSGLLSWFMSGFEGGLTGLRRIVAQNTARDVTDSLRPNLPNDGMRQRILHEVEDSILQQAGVTPPTRTPVPVPPMSAQQQAAVRQQVEGTIRPQIQALLAPAPPIDLSSFSGALNLLGSTNVSNWLSGALLNDGQRATLATTLTNELTDATIRNQSPEDITRRLTTALGQNNGAMLGLQSLSEEQRNVQIQAVAGLITDRYLAAQPGARPPAQTLNQNDIIRSVTIPMLIPGTGIGF